MAIKTEVLNKGLNTSIDPALAPEGTLGKAENARYKPGDPAIWQAEGRRKVGNATGGGHGEVNAIVSMSGIQWDPGTSVDELGNTPELQQLVYRTGNGILTTIPTLDNPADAAMNKTNATSYGYDVDNTWTLAQDVVMGTNPMRTVQFENDHFILTGGDNIRFRRVSGSHQAAARHGMPETSGVFTYARKLTGTETIAPGSHFFWFTWYDSVNDIEGTSEAASLGQRRSTASDSSRGYYASAISDTGGILVSWNKDQFNAAQPGSANKIRIYKAPVDGDATTIPAVGGTPSFSKYPEGYLIAEVLISELVDFNQTLDGVLVDALSYEYDMAQEDTMSVAKPGFKFVTIVVGGAPAINSGRFGEPPKATTGDVLEESLLLNNINDKRKVRFSFPGEPLAFPAVFFVNFETDKTDEVKNIRTLGNVAGIFLGNTIWRLNWLPAQSDFDFARGRVKDVVSETIGTLGSASVARLDWPGKGPALATVDRTGVYITDLYSVKELSENIDWDNLIGKENLNSNTALINNSDERRLELYVGEDIFFFHYDDAHRDQQGNLAITGPMKRSGGVGTATEIVTNVGTKRSVSSNSNGNPFNLYYEGMGFIEEAEASPNNILTFDVETREIYPFGFGNEGRTQRLIAHIKPSEVGGNNIFAQLQTGSGLETLITKTGPAIPAVKRKLILQTHQTMHEYYKVRFVGQSEVGGSSIAVNFITVQAEALGQTETER